MKSNPWLVRLSDQIHLMHRYLFLNELLGRIASAVNGARALLSVIEKNQIATNAKVMENNAGEVYGKISFALWNTSTQTV